MNLRGMLSVIFACHAWVLCAQPDPSKVEFTISQITSNIYMLTGLGSVVGNMIVSTGPDGIVLVDSGYAQLADKIESAIRQISPARIKFVVNTHLHDDHAGANAAFTPKAQL